jgi:hypothetical protein
MAMLYGYYAADAAASVDRKAGADPDAQDAIAPGSAWCTSTSCWSTRCAPSTT